MSVVSCIDALDGIRGASWIAPVGEAISGGDRTHPADRTDRTDRGSTIKTGRSRTRGWHENCATESKRTSSTIPRSRTRTGNTRPHGRAVGCRWDSPTDKMA